jgi:GNAT superfamily N-acetyltransferase
VGISIRTIREPGRALTSAAQVALLEEIVALNLRLSDHEAFVRNWQDRSGSLLASTDVLVVAHERSELVGHCSVRFVDVGGAELAYVDTFTVHPRRQRSGLGFRMGLRMIWNMVRRVRGLELTVGSRTESASLAAGVRRMFGADNYYPSYDPDHRAPPELVGMAEAMASTLWPDLRFSAETGVLEGAYGGRFLPQATTRDVAVRDYFERHVDHDRGDAIVQVFWFRRSTWTAILRDALRRARRRVGWSPTPARRRAPSDPARPR